MMERLGAAAHPRPPTATGKLLRVELDDELLLDGHGDVLARRRSLDRALEAGLVQLQPLRDAAPLDRLQRLVDAHHLAGAVLHLDQVPGLEAEGRHVHLAPVDAEVAVAHQLARLVAGVGEAEAEDHVVEPELQRLQQVLAGLALGGRGVPVGVAEVGLQEAVEALHLLLLAQLDAVLGELDAPLPVLAGGIGPPLDGALVRVAAIPLEVHLQVLAAAEPAHAVGVTSHVGFSLLLHAAALGRPAAVVGDGGHVPDERDLEAGSADSRPAPGPFTSTLTVLSPCSMALAAASPAATCAAKGVDLRDPLKPRAPADDQAITLPEASVMVIMVLLKVAATCTTPVATFFFTRFFPFLGVTGDAVTGSRPPRVGAEGAAPAFSGATAFSAFSGASA